MRSKPQLAHGSPLHHDQRRTTIPSHQHIGNPFSTNPFKLNHPALDLRASGITLVPPSAMDQESTTGILPVLQRPKPGIATPSEVYVHAMLKLTSLQQAIKRAKIPDKQFKRLRRAQLSAFRHAVPYRSGLDQVHQSPSLFCTTIKRSKELAECSLTLPRESTLDDCQEICRSPDMSTIRPPTIRIKGLSGTEWALFCRQVGTSPNELKH